MESGRINLKRYLGTDEGRRLVEEALSREHDLDEVEVLLVRRALNGEFGEDAGVNNVVGKLLATSDAQTVALMNSVKRLSNDAPADRVSSAYGAMKRGLARSGGFTVVDIGDNLLDQVAAVAIGVPHDRSNRSANLAAFIDVENGKFILALSEEVHHHTIVSTYKEYFGRRAPDLLNAFVTHKAGSTAVNLRVHNFYSYIHNETPVDDWKAVEATVVELLGARAVRTTWHDDRLNFDIPLDGYETPPEEAYRRYSENRDVRNALVSILSLDEKTVPRMFEVLRNRDKIDSFPALIDIENGRLLLGTTRSIKHARILMELDGAFSGGFPRLINAFVVTGKPRGRFQIKINSFYGSLVDGYHDFEEIGKGWEDIASSVAAVFEPHAYAIVMRDKSVALEISAEKRPRGIEPVRLDRTGVDINPARPVMMPETSRPSNDGPSLKRTFVMNDELGFHSRAAAQVAALAREFEDTTLTMDGAGTEGVDARSIMMLLMSRVKSGEEMIFTAQGPRAEEVMRELAGLRLNGEPIMLPADFKKPEPGDDDPDDGGLAPIGGGESSGHGSPGPGSMAAPEIGGALYVEADVHETDAAEFEPSEGGGVRFPGTAFRTPAMPALFTGAMMAMPLF